MNLPRYTNSSHATFCGLLLLLTSLPTLAEKCINPVATVVSVQGVAERGTTSGITWQKISAQDGFCAGEMVRTSASSRIALYLNNNTILRLNEHATVTFTKISSQEGSWLNLQKGIAHFISRIKQRFVVETPYVNAAIDGTEFVVAVDSGQTKITVLEGRVRATNEQGETDIKRGQTALVRAGQAPALQLQVKPWDSVSWAMHYPVVLEPQPDAVQKNDTYRAALNLSAGRVAEASANLERALKQNPNNREAIALQAIIAVVQNQPELALKLSQTATTGNPKSAAPWLALSYAQQALFDLEQAHSSVEKAIHLVPKSALAWARLAELHLMFGELDQARQAANRAAEIAPQLARTQAVLGFAYLTRIDIGNAKAAFHKAIKLDQTDPLPRLGLGLAMIREAELAAGRRQIEYAASLAPANPLVRSYLGKAYYEEKRNTLASDQFAMAKVLDPKDPTPWFYDAIQKQTENRTVEALQTMQQSIQLNDNRTVYRSRLLLDEDAAARSASLARIYGDLGFQPLALREGWISLSKDATNHSAHRFLADTYSTQPRHEIARVSELLQAQLWQPLNATPLQPQLAETNLGILDGAGPSKSSFNEFNALFTRNQITGQINATTGGNGILGNDLVVSGIQNNLSFSLGQFHYESDGFRKNGDQQLDIYNLFVQSDLSHKLSIQAELKILEQEKGDLTLHFDPKISRINFRESNEKKSLRTGLRYDFSPHSQMIVSISKEESEFEQTDRPVDNPDVESTEGKQKDNATIGELQHTWRSDRLHIISGLGYFESDSDIDILVTFKPIKITVPFPPFVITTLLDPERILETKGNKHANVYTYLQGSFSNQVSWLVGLSADHFDGTLLETKQINPKLGLIWRPHQNTTLRMAAFRVLKRDLVSNQTIEPTQVVGFNQFYDDINGTDSKRYGLAIDQKLSTQAFTGLELSQRFLNVPFDFDDKTEYAQWRENVYRAYLQYIFGPRTAMRVEYQYEQLKADKSLERDAFEELTTQTLLIGAEYSHPSGLSLNGSARYIDQEGDFVDITAPDQDQFWLVDAGISYRLPKRYGQISIGVKNLFDSTFNYQDSDMEQPTLYPERLLLASFSLAW